MSVLTSFERWSRAGADFFRRVRRHLATTDEELGPAAGWQSEPAAAFVVCPDPLILYCMLGKKLPLGLASVFSDRFGGYSATFLLAFSWSHESQHLIQLVSKGANYCRNHSPHLEFVFLCSSARERRLFARAGERALLLNHNIMVSEQLFHPIEHADIEFDAVYNGALAPFKRHELAAEVPRVAYITYYAPHLGTKSEVQPRLALLRRPPPGHRLMNPIEDDLPVFLRSQAVNEIYSRAAVGLCLSEVEGAMYASMEYMLAGLPIVSTPSKGGRDHFFDADYCLIAKPNPRGIREAVAALRARAIPRDYVRSRTLAKVERDRRRFLELLNEVRERHGAPPQSETYWPYSVGPTSTHSTLCQWKLVEEHWASIGKLIE